LSQWERFKYDGQALMEMALIAGVVILEQEGKHLFIQQSQAKPFAGQWRHPGGHINPGETPVKAMQREIKEELNVDAEIEEKPITTMPSQYRNGDFGFFRGRILNGQIRKEDKEIAGIGWFTPEQALSLPLMEATRTFYLKEMHKQTF